MNRGEKTVTTTVLEPDTLAPTPHFSSLRPQSDLSQNQSGGVECRHTGSQFNVPENLKFKE